MLKQNGACCLTAASYLFDRISGLSLEHQDVRVRLGLLAQGLKYAQENLEKARGGVPHDAIEVKPNAVREGTKGDTGHDFT